MSREKSTNEIALEQSAAGALGAAIGVISHKSLASSPGRIPVIAQVTSAMGAAAAGGAGVSGTVSAGVGVVTAKAAAVVAATTAAAPFVLGAAVIGGVGYGLYKLFKS